MNKLIIFAAILGYASSAPGYLLHETHYPVYHTVSSPSKTTITKNSQLVNHGGHQVLHVPVHNEVHLVHEPVHAHVAHPVYVHEHEPIVHQAKSSQYFKLENTQYHVPKVAVQKVEVHAPIVHQVHSPLLHTHVSRAGDSAVSHHSSTVHETVHEVKSLPLYALHH